MVATTIRASGPRPADSTWERYARPDLWPTWSPQIRRVECAADRLSHGMTGRVIGPFGVAADFVVTAWDEPTQRWSWSVRFGPLRMDLDHGVDESGEGSTTFLHARAPLPVVAAYLPLARLALHRLVH